MTAVDLIGIILAALLSVLIMAAMMTGVANPQPCEFYHQVNGAWTCWHGGG